MRYESRVVNLLGAIVVGAHDRLAEVTQRAAGRTGVTAAALATLAQYPGLTVEQLRRCLGISQPATVRTVDALQAGGLLVRGPGADRRSLALRLTPAGLERAGQVLRARAEVLDPLLDGLGDADRRALETVLEHLLDRLTTSARRADEICRLCDLGACPPDRCPVECAGRRHERVDQDSRDTP
ncbi:MarR family winged helix-turn-helix transcriptional regulator [Microlunatus speluncae]|uniref:MarR family winged helix-turn-helix transcriptional regulator n=1 Tax=Microlunatus speluncae TaxID=2594267 RepID=UPI001375DAB3|nr:MarR family transcriptional regulator [Microlunatus speluncae]